MNAHTPLTFPELQVTTDFRLKSATFIGGGSGTGKTFSALLLARGLAGGKKFAFLDTENGRAKHYLADFQEMQHYDFSAEVGGEMVGFPPERLIAAIDQLEKEYSVLVVDSWSHFWEGINGVLEMADQESARMLADAEGAAQGRYAVDPAKFSQSKWIEPKRRYRRLIERVIRSKMHIIICARAKPVIQKYDRAARSKVNANPTKLRRDDLPWDIAADRDLVFEMTASMILTPERIGEPVMLKCPHQFRGIFKEGRRISEDMGKEIRAWADNGGMDKAVKDAIDAAETAAREGVEAFRAHWKALTPDERAPMRSMLASFQETAERADRYKQEDEDPFQRPAGDAPDDTPLSGGDAPAQTADTHEALAARIVDRVRAGDDPDVLTERVYPDEIARMKDEAPDVFDDMDKTITAVLNGD